MEIFFLFQWIEWPNGTAYIELQFISRVRAANDRKNEGKREGGGLWIYWNIVLSIIKYAHCVARHSEHTLIHVP